MQHFPRKGKAIASGGGGVHEISFREPLINRACHEGSPRSSNQSLFKQETAHKSPKKTNKKEENVKAFAGQFVNKKGCYTSPRAKFIKLRKIKEMSKGRGNSGGKTVPCNMNAKQRGIPSGTLVRIKNKRGARIFHYPPPSPQSLHGLTQRADAARRGTGSRGRI